ncbi:AAA family ATPase [Streptomyces sp. NPDC087300]|uniref:helix-turn-helix transcriptional regulator n=1 Tax=Streptomyces sp. NPDC087300 TaxID=3365780 RepID=UPI00380BEDE4
MRLIERGKELTELADLLQACAQGDSGAAVISAGIGCGKTELLTTVEDLATERGFLVLRAVGSWAERESPGSVLGQLMRRADDRLGERHEIAALLDAVTRGPGAAGDEHGLGHGFAQQTLASDTTGALHRLCQEVARTAQRVPVLICVDDAQFTDSLSLYWLLQLLRQTRSMPIGLLVAECTLSKPAHPQLHAELLRQPNYRHLSLERLTKSGVTALLTDQLGPDTARSLASDYHRVSGGNPLLVRALLEDHRRAGAPLEGAAPRAPVGDAYGETVLSCIHRGRPVLLRLARALAVLGADADPGLLARLLDEDEATMSRGVFALAAAGLLTSGQLHPVARTAMLASVPPQQRAALYGRAAELLYQDGAAATRVAQLLVESEVRSGPWATDVLCQAAERHLAANRIADAHASLEAALRVCEDDHARMSIKALYASTAWMLNPSISARHLGELAVALHDGRLPHRHALPLAKFLLWHGRFDEALDAVHRIVDAPADSSAPDPATAAEIRATRELLSTTYPLSVRMSSRDGGRASRLPRRSEEDPRVLGATALSHVLAHGPDDEAVADAETALRSMRLSKSTQEWIVCATSVLEFTDRLDAAANWCDHWLEQARTRRVPLWEAEFASLRARVALRQGRPKEARRLAEAALTQVPAESWGVCIGGPLANLVHAATWTGDYEAAAAYLEVPVPHGMFRSRFGLYFLHARGCHYLQTGRPYAALDDFTACGDLMRDWDFDQPTLVPWRSESARAQLALADPVRAEELAREELALTGEGSSRARAIALRALAASSPSSARGALLTEAVTLLRDCGDQLQLACALAELSRTRLPEGKTAQARRELQAAGRLAEAAGAAPLAREISGQGFAAPLHGATVLAPPSGLELLTAAERRVAGLAAGDLTNREIAKRLAVTPSTVEQHLTRIFKKLGVRTRRQLPSASVASDQPNRRIDLMAEGQ